MFELKRGAADRISIWVLTALVGMVPLLFVLVGVVMMGESAGAGVFFLVMAAAMGGLTWLCIQEAQARSFANIRLDERALHLRLPTKRGYVAYATVDEAIPRDAISGLETRAEAFRAAGTTAIQYAWSIVLKDGRRIVLGADRRFTEPFYQRAGEALAGALNLPISNRGLVDGHAGFLMMSGQRVPPWDAASVARETLDKRVRDEAFAWRLVALISSAALGIAAIARAFGN